MKDLLFAVLLAAMSKGLSLGVRRFYERLLFTTQVKNDCPLWVELSDRLFS